MNLELFKTLSNYPFINENIFYDSLLLKQNNSCVKKCNEKDCLSYLQSKDSLSEYTCKKGYNTKLLIIGELKVIFNGLIFENNINIAKDRRTAKKEWVISKVLFDIFISRITLIQSSIDDSSNETVLKNFAMFHDFKTSMNILFRCTQDIIVSLPGVSFEDKLETSGRPYKDLYNSLELISSQLQMIDVILNPKSIAFGNKHEINIYKLFFKIKLLFEHLVQKRSYIAINLINVDGAYINNSLCYDSIEFLPLILIDNAIKYSSPGTTIQIEIAQYYRRVKVTVKNIGPFVSDLNSERIFEKFFRDDSAKEFSKEGIGIGLWIAQEILKVHDSRIYYYRDKNAVGKIGLNIFAFELQTV